MNKRPEKDLENPPGQIIENEFPPMYRQFGGRYLKDIIAGAQDRSSEYHKVGHVVYTKKGEQWNREEYEWVEDGDLGSGWKRKKPQEGSSEPVYEKQADGCCHKTVTQRCADCVYQAPDARKHFNPTKLPYAAENRLQKLAEALETVCAKAEWRWEKDFYVSVTDIRKAIKENT